ncbi:tyrosine-type recombinase/integrase [Desulfonema limicola]|nr:tyrosine-type recombinase/integrase [Desulfonema limicola]
MRRLYIIGARPESRARELFLGLYPPYEPVTVYVIRSSISQLMRKAGVLGTPYSLRHTYAQNLLESGASIYEIKEMLGHDSLKSTKKYLHVDIKLMRKVLFNDTI